MTLTPSDVSNARFDKAKRGELGYDEYEVDVLLDRVEATLAGKDTLTAEDVRAVKFTPRKHKKAYAPDAVNAFLREVALTLAGRASHKQNDRAVPAPRSAPRSPKKRPPEPMRTTAATPPPVSVRQMQSAHPRQLGPSDVHNVAFSSPEPGAPACDEDEVDAFLDRIEATLAGRDTLTAHEVLTARFNPPQPGRPGYNEAGVMAFLVMASTSLKQLTERREPAPEDNVLPSERRRPEPVLQAAAETPDLGVQPQGPLQQAPVPPPGHDVYSPETPPVGIPVSVPDPGKTRDVSQISAPTGAPTYDEDQVNVFLDRLEATLEGRDSVTAQDVLAAKFSAPKPGRRGYTEVDFLSLVAKRLEKPDMRSRPDSAAGWYDTTPRPQLTSKEIHDVRLSPPAVGAPGYNAYEVDELLDRVEATLAGRDLLTMQEVRDARFHEVMPGYGGYDQNEVEALLGLIEARLRDDAPLWHA